MKLCHKLNVDAAGRIYIPRELKSIVNIDENTPVYMIVDEDTGNFVIATKDYFEEEEGC